MKSIQEKISTILIIKRGGGANARLSDQMNMPAIKHNSILLPIFMIHHFIHTYTFKELSG